MRRRDFLLLAAVAGAPWNPATAEAQIARIGFVHAGSLQENEGLLEAFRDRLAALGWIDGSNAAILTRWAEARTEQLPHIVKELLGSGVAVLVTAGALATLAATRATARIPIVLVGVDDPVALGIVDSLAHPDGNVTGLCVTSSGVITKRLQLLRDIVPGLHRLAVIVREDPGLDQKLQDIRDSANVMGIETLMLEATTGNALALAFARLNVDRCQAVYVASGPLGPAKRSRIIALAEKSRLPAIYPSRIFCLDGGLISFAADYDDLFRRAAGYVDQILKGAAAGGLPVEPPRKFDLTVNLTTAKALGLTVPPAILASAETIG
jgi:putative tryptophan/tyrosine transport system substrate-binding protein